ncbi:MAG: hypothetical protein KatS3mg038_1186 [Candidatus Kapaibacterium sp.]|nr:MAG: hypothetical protein KatS3mg038_1186 [Candidatus Kapabacteria bacterium]
MPFYYLLLLLSFSLLPSLSAKPAWLDTARNYLHVRETSPNCSRDIERFLRSVGLPCGYAWCAAFVRYCLDAGRALFAVRSASARAYITRKSIAAKHVVKGYRTIERGWLAVWTHSQSWTGHIGFVERPGTRSLLRLRAIRLLATVSTAMVMASIAECARFLRHRQHDYNCDGLRLSGSSAHALIVSHC